MTTTTLRTGLLLALLGAVPACSVEAFESASSEPSVVNSCETDAECGPGAVCGPGICVASHGDLSSLVVAVVPPATAFYGAGDSFLVSLDDVSTADFGRDLELPDYANVVGRVTPDLDESTACSGSYDAANKSLGVHVELTRSEATWGLPSATYEANSQQVDRGWAFETPVPSGVYDVYVSALPDCVSEFPPVLIRQVTFQGPGDVPYALNVSAPSELHGTVKLPEGAPTLLNGWTISLLEPRQGRVISTQYTWQQGDSTEFVLRYHDVDGGDAPLVRLAPPDGAVAPSILWDLSVLDLDGNKEIGLDLTSMGDLLDTTGPGGPNASSLISVHVRARVLDSDAAPGQIAGVGGASVRLRSLSLDNLSGLSARFDTTATADDDGQVQVDLLPGRYRVTVFPPDETNLAMTTEEWLVAKEPRDQAGRTVSVMARPRLEGSVRDPLLSTPLENTTVAVTPSVVAPLSYLERALTPPASTPRPGSGYTDTEGRFDIAVDPGSFDILVQPRADRALPWLVRPRLKVPNEGLGTMTVSFPVPVGGVLRDPNGNAVQQALLRVYAPLDAAGGTVPSPSFATPGVQGVLQVAEVRTDETGTFRILLPATIR